MTQMDFVRIGDHTVRATSLRLDEDSGMVELVAIARGTSDSRILGDLLASSPVQFALPGGPARAMDVARQDHMSSGEAERVITRYQVTLVPAGSGIEPTPGAASLRKGNEQDVKPANPTATDRLADIEQRLSDALEMVRDLRKTRE